MKPDIKFQFNFDGLAVGVEEFNFYAGSPASYMEPPDDAELEIYKAYSQGLKNEWELIPNSVLDWLLENDDFYSDALDACIEMKTKIEEERKEDEADYRYQLRKDEGI